MVVEPFSEIQKDTSNSADKSELHELVRSCNETLKGKNPGFYYRAVSVEEFRTFLRNGELKYDGKYAFQRVSEKLNFNRLSLPEKAQLLFDYVQKIFDTVQIENEVFVYPLKEEITASVNAAIEKQDLSDLVQLLRKIYKGSSNTVLGNLRYGGSIGQYFSDYISTSLGSPLYMTPSDNSSSAIILEFDRDFQENDYYWTQVQANEHEVSVLQLTLGELTHVYSSDNWSELLELLKTRFDGLFNQFDEFKSSLTLDEQVDNSKMIEFFSNFLGQFHRTTTFESLLSLTKKSELS